MLFSSLKKSKITPLLACNRSSCGKVITALATFGLAVCSLSAQTVHFEALQMDGGVKSKASCVVLDSNGSLVSVVALGSDPRKASVEIDGKKLPLTYLANDVNSRLVIYQLPKNAAGLAQKKVLLGSSLEMKASQELHTHEPTGKAEARLVGRVSQFKGKTLPVAVLRVNHQKAAPMPGSGIYDTSGKLVGVVRQPAFDSTDSSYCLPVEVISRTLADQEKNGKVRRCWIGIVMDELVDPPIVESVRPDSPAQKAGLKKGDVLLSIGNQKVDDYSEVVDAFFYLIAGEDKVFKVLRGTQIKEIVVKPQTSPGR